MSTNKDGYDQWSKFYDVYPNPTVATDEVAFPSFWKNIKDKKVLEIGCGTGRHTLKLCKQRNEVTGIDLSSGMLEVARKKLKDFKVEFIEGDFMTLDLKENSFDVVILSLVLEHIHDLKSFFLRLSKVMKPKGEVFISEIHPLRSKDGNLAHFKVGEGEVWLDSAKHTERDFEDSLKGTNLKIISRHDILGESHLTQIKPEWAKHLGKPMIKIFVLSAGEDIQYGQNK
jgi:ubiquinone/menaquinone biosynthesis C-methylase UbiE